MADNELNSLGRQPTTIFNEDFFSGLCEDIEAARMFFNPIKSKYQLALETKGWEYVGNEIATNYHIGLDLPTEPLKVSLRRMREDYETRLYLGKQIGFFRAHFTSGERMPSTEFIEFFRKPVRFVAVYVRDK